MDFLKNIGSNIATGAKDILGRVQSTISKVSPQSITASATQGILGKPVTDAITANKYSIPNVPYQSVEPRQSVQGNMSINPVASTLNGSPFSTPTSYYSSIRSAAPVSQSVGGKSVAVVTPQAASGEQGQSGQGTVGLQGQIISSQGATGLTGGGSNFTGLLGGSGGLNTPASGTTITEDKKVEEARQRILAKQTQTENTSGAVGESVQRQYDNLYVKGPATESPITTPNIPGEIVPTDLQSIMDQTQAFLRTPQAESVSDLQSVVTSLNEVIQKTREQIEATRATPQEPIKETPEQLLWKEQLPPEERQTITALMDQARRDLGLPQIETNILDTMKNIESINTTFQQFFEDVKNNPDLPKGLARRRLEFLDKEYKSKMDSFSSLLERLTEQRTQANDTLDRQFNIIKAEKDETERMADNKRGTLELLITSGAIGGFNEDDIIRWSKEVGIPTSALRKMREVANNPKLEVRGDLKNGLFSVDKRGTVKVISGPVTTPAENFATTTAGLQYGTPEFTSAAINASSAYTKYPVASERQNLSKTKTVLGQASGLIETLKKVDTGPILGTLKSLNPYNFDARSVNATIQGLVPNVARGIYGEVGVLTDTDIRNYIQTLPNIRSTAEQNQFVAALTMRNAYRSFENSLLTLAQSGINVSGFSQDLEAARKLVESTESRLGVSSGGTGGLNVESFDEDNTSGGFFSRLISGLTGN